MNRIVEYAQFPYRAPIVLVFASVWVRSLVSKKIETRNVAIVAGTYILLSILVISNKTVLYTTSVLPMLCILAAVNTDELLRVPRVIGERIRLIFHSGYLRRIARYRIIRSPLPEPKLAGDAKLLWRNRNCSYTETIKQLQTVIPPDARVWGSITFWFGFQHQPLPRNTPISGRSIHSNQRARSQGTRNMGKGFLEIRAGRCERGHRKTGTLVAEFPENR